MTPIFRSTTHVRHNNGKKQQQCSSSSEHAQHHTCCVRRASGRLIVAERQPIVITGQSRTSRAPNDTTASQWYHHQGRVEAKFLMVKSRACAVAASLNTSATYSHWNTASSKPPIDTTCESALRKLMPVTWLEWPAYLQMQAQGSNQAIKKRRRRRRR